MTENVWVPKQLVKVGSWVAVQYHEVNVLNLEQAVVDAQTALEQEAELHTDDCGWWGDWHACNCGAFDTTSSNL